MSSGARFAVFLGIVLSVWLAQHLYVGWRLLSVPLLSSPGGRRALVVWLALGFVTYPLGRMLFAIGWRSVGRTLEYAGAAWMGTLFLMVAALLAVELVTLGGFVLRGTAPWLRGGSAVLALAAAAVAWVGGMMPPRIVSWEVEVSSLPFAADGLEIVQISDVHLGTILGRHRLGVILERVERLAPDVVVITGDLIDGDAGVVEEFLPQLETLRAPLGVFAILGNHEYYAGRERSRALLREAGFTVLDNAAAEVLPGVFVAGVPDARGSAQTGRPEADLERALEGIGDGAPVVLLQHAPEDEARAASAGVDVMLNGHTHGGQIWPFHYLVRTAYRHLAGPYRVGDMVQIVSRGAGQWGPPMRLLAPSDLVHLTLRSPRGGAEPSSGQAS
jgi:predicted MPP superfamily phosphohydrolase